MVEHQDTSGAFVRSLVGVDEEVSWHSACLEALCGHVESQSRGGEVLTKQVFVFQQRLVAEECLGLGQIGLVALMVATDACVYCTPIHVLRSGIQLCL